MHLHVHVADVGMVEEIVGEGAVMCLLSALRDQATYSKEPKWQGMGRDVMKHGTGDGHTIEGRCPSSKF